MSVIFFAQRLRSYRAAGLSSFLIASLVLPVVLLNSGDPLGIGMRPLAEFLLRWDRRPAAVEGPLPTTAACLSNIPVCGLWRENVKQRLFLCCWACGCVCFEWKHSWLPSVEGLVRTTVQEYGGQCWRACVVNFSAHRPNDNDIFKTTSSAASHIPVMRKHVCL